MADFGCQHDGVLETSFDGEEDLPQTEHVRHHCLPHCLPQQDFQCQVNRGTQLLTSDIIDVDDLIETKDSGADPMFDDKTSISELEDKIR